jgi:2,4-dienoyl-CoA reductase-like NADH-dependent reductase (Old Yellow Enzyme family)
MPYAPTELSREEIAQLMVDYASAARRAVDAGYQWIEMHYAHGYLGSSFFSPLANQRTDEYGGSLENRARFHLEALDAVRAVIPEGMPLTMRLGVDDLNADGVQLEEAITAVGWMKEHGLDLADLSLGINSNQMSENPFNQQGYMVGRANRVREEVGIPVATSWNLGDPAFANEMISRELIDLVYVGRPALANAHYPVWAARELGHEDPFGLVPEDWAWWLRNLRAHPASIGWPEVAEGDVATPSLLSAIADPEPERLIA